MARSIFKNFLILFIVGFVPALSPMVYGCSVPVFRYALERWSADEYSVIIFHNGPFAPEQVEIVSKLKSARMTSTGQCNYNIIEVDLAGQISDTMRELYLQHKQATIPWVTVLYPKGLSVNNQVWSGTLEAATPDNLFYSEMRTEIVSRLLDGESAVWILLECGDSRKDDAAAALLEAQLNYCQENLELPDPVDGNEGLLPYVRPDALDSLKIRFSMLRLLRKTASEQILINILLISEPDLNSYDEPIVFPIYGRGRILYALVGKGITQDNIRKAAQFIVGPCSCVVKADNPGTDILLAADWGSIKGGPIVENSITGVSSGDISKDNGASGHLGMVVLNIIIVLILLGLIDVIIVRYFLLKKKKN